MLPDAALPTWPPWYAQDPDALRLSQEGGRPHSELYRTVGREVPESLQLYESLGRFRDALLAYEWQTDVDVTRRARLERIMRLYSACDLDLHAPQASDAKLTTAP